MGKRCSINTLNLSKETQDILNNKANNPPALAMKMDRLLDSFEYRDTYRNKLTKHVVK